MIQTRFFNGPEYSAGDFASYHSCIYSTGVINRPDSNALKVTAGTGMAVNIFNGVAFINGYQVQAINESKTLEITTTSGRYDRIVIRLDLDATPQELRIYAKQGSSSAPPNLERSLNVYEISLASIYIPPNSSTLINAVLTDDRVDPLLCGISSFYGGEMHYGPAGVVWSFAGEVVPAGFLLCNGAAHSRITYARLFNAIGTIYGAGNGTTTFNVPDIRGVFIRGLDNGRGVDPQRTIGSHQDGTLMTTDKFGSRYVSGGDLEHSVMTTTGGSSSATDKPAVYVRPKNIAMNYIITI